MQRILLALFWVIGLGVAQGQHSEFSVQAGSGLFSFRGSGAVSQTGVAIGDPRLVNPYGRNSGFSYSVAGQWQQMSRSGLVLGVQAGYESLTSRAAILYVNGDFTSNPANGNIRLRNQYVNLHPFVGKRFGTTEGSLDLTAGVDLAYGVASTGSILLDSDNTPRGHITAVDYDMPTVDVRPRINLTGYYRSFGLNVGYSYGLLNYTPNSWSYATSVYSQYWRAGLNYRFGRRG